MEDEYWEKRDQKERFVHVELGVFLYGIIQHRLLTKYDNKNDNNDNDEMMK